MLVVGWRALLFAGETFGLVAGVETAPPKAAVRPERVSAMRLSPTAGWATTTLIARYVPS